MMKQRNVYGLNVLMVFVLIFIGHSKMFAQNTSGILIGGGAGSMDTHFEKNIPLSQNGNLFDGTYNYDLHVGYRYSLKQSRLFFWNFDALFGLKRIDKSSFRGYTDNGSFLNYADAGKNLNYYIAFSPSANVNVWKGLYLGVGVAPTCYFYQSRDKNWDFDLPVVAKVGYDFGIMSLEASFGYGLLKDSQVPMLKNNRKKEFQLSLYVPLWRR